ncbi:MAG: hypothetical protein AAGJ34_01915 [Pseudomonadota bacterium]
MAGSFEIAKASYSSWIKAIERMLWVLAIFAGFSVFIFATPKQNGDAFLFDNSDLLALALGEQITDATFTGVTNGNDAFTVGAQSATPNGPRPTFISLEQPTTNIVLSSGQTVFGRSNEGTFDIEARRVTMSGASIITSSDGYRIDSGEIRLDFKSSELRAIDSVSVQAPYGQITADDLRMTGRQTADGQTKFKFEFDGGVRLTYQPGETGE